MIPAVAGGGAVAVGPETGVPAALTAGVSRVAVKHPLECFAHASPACCADGSLCEGSGGLITRGWAGVGRALP